MKKETNRVTDLPDSARVLRNPPGSLPVDQLPMPF
jgi:hypothetical protein